MCGLVLAFSKRGKNTGDYVYQLFNKQRTRGQQGFGFLCIQDGKLVKVHRAKWGHEIEKELKGDKSDIILFHHRFPTSTKNTVGTTHPMFVSNPALKYDYYFAHNGVITNTDLLKKEHEKLGYKYNTEFHEQTKAVYADGTEEVLDSEKSVHNDSESLAIELARWIEGLTKSIDTRGGAAFWGISLEKGTNNVVNLYFGKNKGRDLKMFDNKNWLAISSESGEDLVDMVLHTVDIHTYEMDEQALLIDEAKPVETKTVTTTHETYKERERRMGFDDKKTAPLALPYKSEVDIHSTNDINKKGSLIPSPFVLMDAYYTYNQACDTGFPIDEFYPTWVDGEKFWVPMQFRENIERPFFTGMIDSTMVSQVLNQKAVDMLHTHIKTLLKLEDTIQELNDCIDNEWISEDTYLKEGNETELKIEEVNELISALGLPIEFCEDEIDKARDAHSFITSVIVTDADLKNINK